MSSEQQDRGSNPAPPSTTPPQESFLPALRHQPPYRGPWNPAYFVPTSPSDTSYRAPTPEAPSFFPHYAAYPLSPDTVDTRHSQHSFCPQFHSYAERQPDNPYATPPTPYSRPSLDLRQPRYSLDLGSSPATLDLQPHRHSYPQHPHPQPISPSVSPYASQSFEEDEFAYPPTPRTEASSSRRSSLEEKRRYSVEEQTERFSLEEETERRGSFDDGKVPGTMPYRPGVTPFASKLHWILEHPAQYGECVKWAENSDVVLIATQHPEFLTKVLSTLFSHSSLVSFLRQLHLYGFQRLSTTAQQEAQGLSTSSLPASDSEDWRAFEHPYMKKADASQLHLLRPKPSKARQIKKQKTLAAKASTTER